MFLGLVISVIPRKSVIFGGKIVGVAGFEPNIYLYDDSVILTILLKAFSKPYILRNKKDQFG